MSGPTWTIPAETSSTSSTTVSTTEEDDLFGADEMRTAVLLSLFSDRRAEDDDALPANDGDKRGWLGDEFAEVADDKIGSRLWLLDRAKRVDGIGALAELYAREALAWMLTDRLASAINVTSETSTGSLYLAVEIVKPSGEDISYKFAHVWDSVGWELRSEVYA